MCRNIWCCRRVFVRTEGRHGQMPEGAAGDLDRRTIALITAAASWPSTLWVHFLTEIHIFVMIDLRHFEMLHWKHMKNMIKLFIRKYFMTSITFIISSHCTKGLLREHIMLRFGEFLQLLTVLSNTKTQNFLFVNWLPFLCLNKCLWIELKSIEEANRTHKWNCELKLNIMKLN